MSCLFNSLSRFTPGVSSSELRQKICDYLSNDSLGLVNIPGTCSIESSEIKPSDVAKLEGMTLEQYIAKMRIPSTWGGALEIAVFIRLYNMDVEVVNIRDKNKKNIEFVVSGNTKKVRISWNGGHYEPIP
jgi:hypothetical protein